MELHWLKDGRTRCTTGSVVSPLYALKDPTATPAAAPGSPTIVHLRPSLLPLLRRSSSLSHLSFLRFLSPMTNYSEID
ncbi:hypothetical protein C8J57DRAFT_1321177 [Mycena rebaudengoi]|nr:hypothetical protein C8J57DRAFT_1321177 [Mycena rebaudengoi]